MFSLKESISHDASVLYHLNLFWFVLSWERFITMVTKFQEGNFVCGQAKIVNNDFIVVNALRNECMLGKPR